jgi:succinate dehydrogenase/fumarate reductase-like Fe-S protein
MFGLIQQLSIYRGIYSKLYSKSEVGPRGARQHVTHVHAYMHMHMCMHTCTCTCACTCLRATATFLAKHELSSYTAAFDEHGRDSLPALQETSPTMT